MRLINSQFMTLESFDDSEIPPYAILSHTWGNEEISFSDMQDLVSASRKAGFGKLRGTCRLALEDGFSYVWLDTCCIDKSSSSELSEAINSMYAWYEKAEVCYVYMSDVPRNCEIVQGFSHKESAFMASRYFTRGWTLQEVIAPTSVIFYDKDWDEIGTKSSLQDLITLQTSIQGEVLLGDADPRDYSVAQRMSWASFREVTRVEDTAYCLLGLMDVHIPLLYGEGNRAFFRLQEEILKRSDDYSLFAWTSTPAEWDVLEENDTSLFANSPDNFAGSYDVVQWHKMNLSQSFEGISEPFESTSKGIRLRAYKVEKSNFCMQDSVSIIEDSPRSSSPTIDCVILNCARLGQSDQMLAIGLKARNSAVNTSQFSRAFNQYDGGLLQIAATASRSESFYPAYVKQRDDTTSEIDKAFSRFSKSYDGIFFEASNRAQCFPLEQYPRKFIRMQRDGQILITREEMRADNNSDFIGVAKYSWPDKKDFVLVFQITRGSEDLSRRLQIDMVHAEPEWESESLEEMYWSFKSEVEVIESNASRKYHRTWRESTDRMTWDDPQEKWKLKLTIKRRIVCSQRKLVVNLDCIPMPHRY